MTSTMEKEGKNQVKLTVTVDAETFENAVEKAYVKNKGRMNVQGFRKGKAPRRVMEKLYGENVFYGDAMEDAWAPAYYAAVAEHALDPVDDPSIEIDNVGPDGFVFTATVTVRPEVTLGAYKGIEATRVSYTVPDAMVEQEIEQARARNARMVAVERPAALGDTVEMDYAGTVDGVAFEGGTAEDQSLELGSGHFIPGFEEQLVNCRAGDELDVSVTFPEDYHAKDVAGKPAVFHVTVHEVQEKQLPELDDEFVKDVTDDCDTLDAYRASILARIAGEAKSQSDNQFDNEMFGKVVESAEVEIPSVMVEREIDALLRDFERQMSRQGISMEMFKQYTGSTDAQMRERYRDEAARRVKSQLVLEAIRKAEGIEATDEEIEKEIVKLAEGAQQDVEEIRKKIGEDERRYIADEVAVQKTLDMLRAEAVVKSEDRVFGEPAPGETDAQAPAGAEEAEGGAEIPQDAPEAE